jgi:hypothetical protein
MCLLAEGSGLTDIMHITSRFKGIIKTLKPCCCYYMYSVFEHQDNIHFSQHNIFVFLRSLTIEYPLTLRFFSWTLFIVWGTTNTQHISITNSTPLFRFHIVPSCSSRAELFSKNKIPLLSLRIFCEIHCRTVLCSILYTVDLFDQKRKPFVCWPE